MKSVVRNTMVIVSLGRTIALGVERVATRLSISLIYRGNFKLVVLTLMLQRRITFMHFCLDVSNIVIPMWSPVCCKSSVLIFILYLTRVLHFFTPLISRMFDIFPDILNEPFMVSTPVCELVVTKRVNRNFPIVFLN